MDSRHVLFISGIVAVTVLLFCGMGAASPEYVEGQIFVCYADDTIPVADDIICDFSRSVPGLYLIKIEGSVEEAVAKYSALPNVRYAEPDYVVSASNVPNDPKYPDELWNMVNAHAEEAWDITTGSKDVIVAVVDTGINYNHEDLIDNMWTDENGKHGYNFVNNTDDPMDDHGHGTHCAGIVGAVGNNGKGVVGMAWNVSLMAVKCLNATGQGSTSAIIQGIQYAADNGAKIISMSLGGQAVSQARTEVIRSISDKAVIVAAAGNEANNNDLIYKGPANTKSKNIIRIAAIDKDNSLASFSNFGIHNVDVAAPGVKILSAAHNDNSGYVVMSGTSMATPLVSGIAALMYSVNETLYPFEVVGIIKKTVDPVSSLNGMIATGGKVNAKTAVETVNDNNFCDVYFDSNGGSEVYPDIALTNGTVDEPAEPVKSGYTFDGWYTSSNTKWDFTTQVTENMTLQAHWIEKETVSHTPHDDIETAWSETDSLPTTSGKYYLTNDVYLTETWEVTNEIILCLNGQTISGEPSSGTLITVSETGDLTLYDCTETGTISGYAINQEFPMHNDESVLLMAVPSKPTYTQGLTVEGICTLNGGTLTDFSASDKGGAVYVNGGTFIMNGGIITKSSGNYGGGVYVVNKGTFTMTGGTIINCVATYGGGVAVSDSIAAMNNGSIINCVAANGGGLFAEKSSTLTLSKTDIENCSASLGGGGLYISESTCTMSDGKISGCIVQGSGNLEIGGGVCFDTDGTLKPSSFEMSGDAEITNCHVCALTGNEALSGGGMNGGTNTTITLRDNAKISGCTAKYYKYQTLIEEMPDGLSTDGKIAVYDNAYIDVMNCSLRNSIQTNASYAGSVQNITMSLFDDTGRIISLSVNPFIVVDGGNAEMVITHFTLTERQSMTFKLGTDNANSCLYLKSTGSYTPEKFDVQFTQTGDTLTIHDLGEMKIVTQGGNGVMLVNEDAQVATSMMYLNYVLSAVDVYAIVTFNEAIPAPASSPYLDSIGGTYVESQVVYPYFLLETPECSGSLVVSATVKTTKFSTDIPSFKTTYDKSAAAKIRAFVPGAVPVSILTSLDDANIRDIVDKVFLHYYISSDMEIPEDMKAAFYQIDATGVTPLKIIDETNGTYNVEAGKLSTYVFAFVPEHPKPTPVSSGSSSDSGSGNYTEYLRTVINGGEVDFGTSKVVGSVVLPKGTKGDVTLHLNETTKWPNTKSPEYIFEISVSNPEDGDSIIRYKIGKSALSEAGAEKTGIAVYHMVNDEWQKLDNKVVGEDRTYYYYEAVTPSFSTFKLVLEENGAANSVDSDSEKQQVNSAAQMYSTEKIIIKIDESKISITDLPEEYEYISLGGLGLYTASVPKDKTVDETIRFFTGLNGVMYAEPDGYVYLDSSKTETEETESQPAETETPASPVPLAGIAAGSAVCWMMLKRRV